MKQKLYLIFSCGLLFLLMAGCGAQDEAESQQKELRYYIEQLRDNDMFLSTGARLDRRFE